MAVVWRVGDLHEGHMAIPVTHIRGPGDGWTQDLLNALPQGHIEHPKWCGWWRCRWQGDENTNIFETVMVVCEAKDLSVPALSTCPSNCQMCAYQVWFHEAASYCHLQHTERYTSLMLWVGRATDMWYDSSLTCIWKSKDTAPRHKCRKHHSHRWGQWLVDWLGVGEGGGHQ